MLAPTTRPQTVRAAVPADAAAIYALLCAAHAENGWFSMNQDKVRALIAQLTPPPPHLAPWGIIGVIDDGAGGLAGAVAAVIDSFWYSDESYVSERFCFVREDCRRSTHAKDLIQFAKYFADALHLPLELGVLSTTRTEAKMRLYRRQLKQVGGYFAHGFERAKGPLATEMTDGQ